MSKVYLNSVQPDTQVMTDVARIEAGEGGFWLIDLFGQRRFIMASIQSLNFMDGQCVMRERTSHGNSAV